MPGLFKPAERISIKQQAFVDVILQNPGITQTEAARRAGYKDPDGMACKLMNPNECPLVVRAIEAGLAERSKKAKMSGDDVLQYLHNTMTFRPLDHFKPGRNGKWEITEEALKALPPEIGMLIEEVETVTSTDPDGAVTSKCLVRLVPKRIAMTLAAKHQLGEKLTVQGTVVRVNWDDLTSMQQRALDGPDPIEQRILGAHMSE
jgi:hypothetical protein